MKQPADITDPQKVYLLERILKSLYEGDEIEYHLFKKEDSNEELYGYIRITNVNTNNIPSVCEACDPDLSQDLDAVIRKEDWREEFNMEVNRAHIDVEIWVSGDTKLKIANLERKNKELTERLSPVEAQSFVP